jgi:glycosyltransferase involved in cell wall biosynthesis
MKILHINTTDKGGAANACLRLHEGLLSAGIDSKVLVLNKSNNNFHEVYEYEIAKERTFPARLRRKIGRILKEVGLSKEKIFIKESKNERQNLQRLRSKSLEMFSFPESNIDITNNKFFREADVIHLHWVARFLDYKTFFAKCNKPIVWTFHDQNPFLGVEHYAEKFLRPDNQGFPTIRQFDDYELEIEEKYKRIKREIFKETPLNIIALCNWMKDEVVDSQVFMLSNIDIIPNGIDSNQFRILDRNFCRELLNLPLDKKIIFFVSNNIDNNRKGLAYLLKTFENTEVDNLVICSIGNKTSFQNENKNFIELGAIHDQRLMNVAYSAADVFVIPSLVDNLPNTVIESLLCGIPVISFPVGGMIDMIKHKQNGYITKEISVGALSNAINLFFREGIEWTSDKIREDAVERYDISVQVKNVLKLYNDIWNDD